jgi:HEAT repeat protein
MEALISIGPNGYPMLRDVLRLTKGPYQVFYTMEFTKRMCPLVTEAQDLAPMFVNWLDDPDPIVAGCAAHVLGDRAEHPDLCVPALARTLQHTNEGARWNAAYALQRFGPCAQRALPALTNALNDPAAGVRHQASNAIVSITYPPPTTNSPPR